MAKKATVHYICSDCGANHSKWAGQCSNCSAWNTLVETKNTADINNKSPSVKVVGYAGLDASETTLLSDVDLNELPRFSSGSTEFDRVLGGGLVPGSVILLGGHPGAGKSTLLLQTMCHLSKNFSALYVTGEESLQQVAMRAKRLCLKTDQLFMLSETQVERICDKAKELKPRVLVVDSIQAVYSQDITSAPGSVTQVRECAAYLTRYAKQTGTVIFIIGHITKGGDLSGPMVLEHMVDQSTIIEGDENRYRWMRSKKNRFGNVTEVGVFAMTEKGLLEVKNPSAIFLSREKNIAPGSVVMVMWEGTRPILAEVQALVDESVLNNPKRVTVGLDHNRLAMLLAVLHRHGGYMVGDQDVFVNVVGGLKISETGADLSLLAAIISSFKNNSLPQNLVTFGEVGLTGEIRPVTSGQERIAEAAKHGFKKAVVPKSNIPKRKIEGIDVIGVTTLSEAIDAIF